MSDKECSKHGIRWNYNCEECELKCPEEHRGKCNDKYNYSYCESVAALREIANWPDGGIRYGQSKIKAFASKSLSEFCEPESASPDQIEIGKLAAFGKTVWDWIKDNPDFCGDEFSETFLPMAEEAGLCRKEPYDPERHGNIEYGEVGIDIWTWD